MHHHHDHHDHHDHHHDHHHSMRHHVLGGAGTMLLQFGLHAASCRISATASSNCAPRAR